MRRAGTSSSAGTTDPARRPAAVLRGAGPWLIAALCGCGPGNLFAPWDTGAGPAWVQEGGSVDGRHTAADGPEPPLSLVWRQAVGGAPLGGALIAGPVLLQLTRDTDVLAFDLATGTRLGRRRLDRPLCAAAADGGRVLWRRSLGAAVRARPAVDAEAGRLWTATADGTVHGLRADDGGTVWTARVGGLPAGGLSRGAGVIAAGSSDRALYAFDPESGRGLWRFEAGGILRAPPTSTTTTLYLGSGGSVLHAVDGASGEARWRYALDGPVLTTAAVAGLLQAATTETGTLYLFRGR